MCGESWFNIFQESLSYEEKHQILFTKRDNQYKVDDGAQVTAVSRPIIPITLGTIKTEMHVDIIPSNIPLSSTFKRISETSKYETQFRK